MSEVRKVESGRERPQPGLAAGAGRAGFGEFVPLPDTAVNGRSCQNPPSYSAERSGRRAPQFTAFSKVAGDPGSGHCDYAADWSEGFARYKKLLKTCRLVR